MADPRFFRRHGPFTLADLAVASGAEPGTGADPGLVLEDVAPLDTAGAGQISFLDNRRYIAAFEASRAAACIVSPDLADRAPAGIALLISTQPYRAYALVARQFYPDPPVIPAIDPRAIVAPTVRIAPGCRIAPGVVIGEGVEIGPDTTIGPQTVIAENVVIGARCRIATQVSLTHCVIGNDVVLFPGARIGQAGFGFHPSPDGHLDVPQLGRAIIHDDVSIGANSTVDRGSGPDTVIGRGCRIDNLVQIGHNVVLGEGCVLAGQVGISGSTRVGRFVMMGGQAGLAGHLTIGDGARIGAQCGVMRDVAAGETVIGSPAQPVKDFWRQTNWLQKQAQHRPGRGGA